MILQEKKGEGEISKKRGRRSKDEKREYMVNRQQSKFFVDLSGDKGSLSKIWELLAKVNNKSHGKVITFRELSLFAIAKLTDKDLEKIKETSLSEMEKVERLLSEYNQKNNTSMELGEFLVKQLRI